jgi:hypothetical protein
MRFASASTCLNRGENVLATAMVLYGDGSRMGVMINFVSHEL